MLTAIDLFVDDGGLGTLVHIRDRLSLECRTADIAAGVHHPLQSIGLPAEHVITVRAKAGPEVTIRKTFLSAYVKGAALTCRPGSSRKAANRRWATQSCC